MAAGAHTLAQPSEARAAAIAPHGALLELRPSPDLDRGIRVSDTHGDAETDGEWESDEIRLTAVIGRFDPGAGKPEVESRVLQMPDVMTDVDAGDRLRPNWDRIGSATAPARLAGSTVIGLIGCEVGCCDAWTERINNWTSGFKNVIGTIRDAIKDKVGAIGAALAKAGVVVADRRCS